MKNKQSEEKRLNKEAKIQEAKQREQQTLMEQRRNFLDKEKKADLQREEFEKKRDMVKKNRSQLAFQKAKMIEQVKD